MSRTAAPTAEEHGGSKAKREVCFVGGEKKAPKEEQQVLGGSVSMATSQLGKRCKSKREGDIKGLNDTEGRGGQRETADEDKEEKRRRRWRGKREEEVERGGGGWSDVHFHFTC